MVGQIEDLGHSKRSKVDQYTDAHANQSKKGHKKPEDWILRTEQEIIFREVYCRLRSVTTHAKKASRLRVRRGSA